MLTHSIRIHQNLANLGVSAVSGLGLPKAPVYNVFRPVRLQLNALSASGLAIVGCCLYCNFADAEYQPELGHEDRAMPSDKLHAHEIGHHLSLVPTCKQSHA